MEGIDPNTDLSTEEKLKQAAKRVFVRKGYAASRTRDIADEAGINLALLNYYFRSKENLFEIVMTETLKSFLIGMKEILNDGTTTLQQKFEAIVGHYIDLIILNPDLPNFVMGTISSSGAEVFIAKMGFDKVFEEAYIMQQMQELLADRKLPFNPIHVFINMISMVIFPFLVRPIIKYKQGLGDIEFEMLMRERKKLIPIWVGAMLMLDYKDKI